MNPVVMNDGKIREKGGESYIDMKCEGKTWVCPNKEFLKCITQNDKLFSMNKKESQQKIACIAYG